MSNGTWLDRQRRLSSSPACPARVFSCGVRRHDGGAARRTLSSAGQEPWSEGGALELLVRAGAARPLDEAGTVGGGGVGHVEALAAVPGLEGTNLPVLLLKMTLGRSMLAPASSVALDRVRTFRLNSQPTLITPPPWAWTTAPVVSVNWVALVTVTDAAVAGEPGPQRGSPGLRRRQASLPARPEFRRGAVSCLTLSGMSGPPGSGAYPPVTSGARMRG